MGFESWNEWAQEEKPESSRLLMVGVCLGNVVGSGKGPVLEYCAPESLKSVKQSHPELVNSLSGLVSHEIIDEAWIWNTCNRFEVYAIYSGSSEVVEDFVRTRLFHKIKPQTARLNVLHGEAAVHHLLRTNLGLNSALPGELDVKKQFEAALRLSRSTGSIGKKGWALFKRVMKACERIRATTDWKRFAPNYCQAALERVLSPGEVERIRVGPIAVIGSSTTSKSCVEALENEFGIDPEQITVYHRCHHKDGQMKSIRRASGGCNRIRVEDYEVAPVAEAIARSSLTIFGIDRKQPVVDGEQLNNHRSGGGERTILVDFNTFGSTNGLETTDRFTLYNAQNLENEVRCYAAGLAQAPHFQSVVEELEDLVCEFVRKFDLPALLRSQSEQAYLAVESGAGVLE